MENVDEIDTDENNYIFTLTACSSFSDDSSVESCTNRCVSTMSNNRADNQRNMFQIVNNGLDNIDVTTNVDDELPPIPSTQAFMYKPL